MEQHKPTPVHATTLQLLLNLYLREYQDWYYLDIEPRYDPALKAYMAAQPESQFIRINLKQQELVIYYPLRYYSLCGMHEAGDRPVLQKGIEDSLEPVSPGYCMQLLLQEITESTIDLDALLNKLPEHYHQLSGCEATATDIPGLTPFTLPEHRSKTLLPATSFCFEYNSTDEAFLLKDIIAQYGQATGLDPATAANSWIRRYFEITLNAVLQLRYHHNILPVAHYRNTYLQIDDNGFPEQVYFEKHSLARTSPAQSTPRRQKENEERLLQYAFSLNLYCLIRNAGMYGLQTETILLETLYDTLQDLTALYPEAAFIATRKRIPMPCCLDQLVSGIPLPYLKKEVQVHNHIINIPYYSKQLIKPATGETLHRRYFEGGELELSLRAFDIEQDVPLFHDWVNREYAKKFWQMDGPIKGLEREYIKHLGVDYSHPYVGMLNQTPFCTIELYWTPKDEVGKYYPFHPGDYGFHMLVAPAERRIRNLSTYILATAMEYFFSFPQVNRMIGEADADHEGTHNLITKVGCEFERSLELPYKTSNLTFCTRQQFHKATQDIFRNSITSLNIVNY
ncbi:GNAT family N-acetyltransferase [Taibaiella chishuiensis]|uniref:Ferric iron reductase FhuF-like transporter n=1 Tax=Taibaiella chishuiensis TaxID=1434707 RepID=A0A2P8D663_9BACT|nr:GNAT family N-acetyltransferase [Taibaiella chishuiensis]PSK92681.1 ferric iron reductase FhuF-like transporter [Taibaiella chishuiensis]